MKIILTISLIFVLSLLSLSMVSKNKPMEIDESNLGSIIVKDLNDDYYRLKPNFNQSFSIDEVDGDDMVIPTYNRDEL